MDELWTVAVGLFVGLAVIVVLNMFPGEPFDYDKNSPNPSQEEETSIQAIAGAASATTKAELVREVEIAAQQIKCDKLQELLGLEKHEVQRMIDQAKRDAIDGRRPQSSTDYTRWLDYAFYAVILTLMVLVLRAEYSLDVLKMLAHAFPREAEAAAKVAETARKMAAMVELPQVLSSWT